MIDDVREVMPLCVVKDIRERWPNPPDVPYQGHHRIIANIYQIFLVYLTYYAPYRSVLINSVIGCYISTSQIKHGHYILGIIISISHFFSIVL